uniref:Large ribosomal subunit protein eL6 n=1 Tax=Trichuris muris TaxID=70415 RepID=A0A5S6QRW5_TRIMR
MATLKRRKYDIPDGKRLIVILENAQLEVAKVGNNLELLSSHKHANFLSKLRKNPADYRPDITHQCLLMLLDSPLNKAGLLQIFVHTARNTIFEINSHTRMPRTYDRFAGLMVQLLSKRSIQAAETSQTLMKIIKNPIEQYLPVGSKKYSTSSQAPNLTGIRQFVPENQSAVIVVGAVAHGQIKPAYCEEILKISNYSLSAALVCAKICTAFEEAWGASTSRLDVSYSFSMATERKKKTLTRRSRRNWPLGKSGLMRFSRARMYEKRAVFKRITDKPPAAKKKEPKQLYIVKRIGGEKNGKIRRILKRKPPKLYSVVRRRPRKELAPNKLFKNHERKLKPSLTPGTIVIILAGLHRGKRCVFLKQLKSGLLLVTGPLKLNGCPLRRINQIYVIGTKTKLDLGDFCVPKHLNDAYFRRVKAKKQKKSDTDIFATKKERYKVSDIRKRDQAKVDKAVMASIKKRDDKQLMCGYLATPRCKLRLNISSLYPMCRPVVLSGPSGCGKSTLLQRLLQEHPDKYAVCISHTTRKPRPGERHGVEYYFTTKSEMTDAIERGEFIEHAEFGGNLYGTSLEAVRNIQQAGKRSKLNPICILLKPPSMEVLESRLRDRGTESEDAVRKRLSLAVKDLKAAETESDLFDHVIINDNMDQAYHELCALLSAQDSLASAMK